MLPIWASYSNIGHDVTSSLYFPYSSEATLLVMGYPLFFVVMRQSLYSPILIINTGGAFPLWSPVSIDLALMKLRIFLFYKAESDLNRLIHLPQH